MELLETLRKEYSDVLNSQHFDHNELDYTIFEQYLPLLKNISKVNNSGVTVFDMYKKQHIYTSYNFSDLFGYDIAKIEKHGNAYFDSRVHPEDYLQNLQTGINVIRLYNQTDVQIRRNYKFINEYRVLGAEQKYIRVIEQHQVLELDKSGNIWLSIGVIDISPDQGEFTGVKTQLINYKSGEIIPIPSGTTTNSVLTKREKEILTLIKSGLLSKEISDKLFISVHTVNTHRQRILEKLNASNSVEAVQFASSLGLLN